MKAPRSFKNKHPQTRSLLTLILGTALLFNTTLAFGYGSMMGGGMMSGGMMGGGMMGGSAATPQSKTDSNDQALDNNPGAKLFQRDCSQCHALPSPLAHKANQWPSVVERMRTHLRQYGGRDLSEKETKAILDYLKEHAQR